MTGRTLALMALTLVADVERLKLPVCHPATSSGAGR